MKLKKNVIEKLKKVLRKENSIKLAYLFGSYAKGTARRLSDVDIAILFDSKMTENQMIKKEFQIAGELSIFFDKFDLVVLNRGYDTILKYNIIKDGIILKNNKIRPKFEFELMHEYLDMEYHYELRSDVLLDRIAKGGL